MKIGICKLCQQKAELVESHLIPKAIYKRIRRSNGANNRIVAVSHAVAMFSDKQVKDYLLCVACEGRFGRVEDYTVSNCLQEDSFPFREAVLGLPRHLEANDVALGQYLEGGGIEMLVYFAASVLWRAAVHRWRGVGGSTITVNLGSYEEGFRLYLLDKADFPVETTIGIFVAGKANELDQFATTPIALDVKGYQQYTFVIPGIKFSIVVGRDRPEEMRAGCSLRSSGQYIYIDDHLDRHELAFQMGRTRVSQKIQDGLAPIFDTIS